MNNLKKYQMIFKLRTLMNLKIIYNNKNIKNKTYQKIMMIMMNKICKLLINI